MTTRSQQPIQPQTATLSADLVTTRVSECVVTLCGAGAVGRALADHFPALGVARVNVIDPKHYSDRSVATQCDPGDVGRFKADVVGSLARERGVNAHVTTADLFGVPDGLVGESGVVISCTDNTRALIGANRIAARMRCRFLKVNIEPLCDAISIRAYLPCASHRPCAECQLSDRHYDLQRHPHSCDADGNQRQTDSPRALTTAAGQLAAEALGALLSDGPATAEWYGYETLHHLRTGQIIRSTLSRFAECRWDHASHWSNLFWLPESPSEVSLEHLVPLAHRAPSDRVQFAFDHSVTRWVGCDSCHNRRRMTRWFADLRATIGACPSCGGRLRPFSFGARQSATSRQLRDVYRQPLADWGVPTGAVIEVNVQGYIRTFIPRGATLVPAVAATPEAMIP